MSNFELGQRVHFTDHLVRVSISNHSIADDLLQQAMDLMAIRRERDGRKWHGLSWKMWVPTWFAKAHLHKGLCMISPLEDHGDVGFVVQRATLQQGGTYHGDGWDNPPIWMDHGTTRAYKLAVNLRRNPILVLPEHITPIDKDGTE